MENLLCYHSMVNDQNAFFGVNKTLSKKKVKPQLFSIAKLTFNLKGNNHSLPNDEEADKFIDNLDMINNFFNESHSDRVVFVGFWLRPRYGEIFYYLNEKDQPFFEEVINTFAKKLHRKIQIKIQKDPTWATYFDFLYPTPRSLKVIECTEIIYQLDAQELPLNKNYIVDHRFYFLEEEKMMACLSELEAIETEWNLGKFHHSTSPIQVFEDEDEEKAYLVIIEQKTQLDGTLIHDTVALFYDLAKKYNGTYIDWQLDEKFLPKKTFH